MARSIPIRTGVNIENETIIRLYDTVENIIGIKDATGDLRQTMELINFVKNREKKFYVLSGEDLLTFPIMALGGDGVIAASAHIVGAKYKEICEKCAKGDLDGARATHYEVMDITKALFAEPNPTAIKACFKLIGIDVGDVRLPLVPAQQSTYHCLEKELKNLGILI